MTADPLDRCSRTPLWVQLATDLRRRLDDGEFRVRLPTDHELMAEYGVSRHTAREGVRSLHEEGLIERHRGRGTFVRHQPFEQPLGEVYSLFRSVESLGARQTSAVLDLDLRREPAVAARLDLRARSALLYLARRRDADVEPLALERAWLPGRFAPELLQVDFAHASLLDELAARCDVVVDDVAERIQAVVPSRYHRTVLALPAGVAAFAVERLATAAGVPVEWSVSVVRGDRYTYIAHGAERPGGPERLRAVIGT
jgi:GntR family transcriptional regulator